MPVDMTRPGESFAQVTKSDTVDVGRVGSEYPRALYVGGAGVVVLVAPDGTSAPFTAVAGAMLPFRFKRVNSTNTTATLMVAIY